MNLLSGHWSAWISTVYLILDTNFNILVKNNKTHRLTLWVLLVMRFIRKVHAVDVFLLELYFGIRLLLLAKVMVTVEG